jgi:hypothetical protein
MGQVHCNATAPVLSWHGYLPAAFSMYLSARVIFISYFEKYTSNEPKNRCMVPNRFYDTGFQGPSSRHQRETGSMSRSEDVDFPRLAAQ